MAKLKHAQNAKDKESLSNRLTWELDLTCRCKSSAIDVEEEELSSPNDAKSVQARKLSLIPRLSSSWSSQA